MGLVFGRFLGNGDGGRRRGVRGCMKDLEIRIFFCKMGRIVIIIIIINDDDNNDVYLLFCMYIKLVKMRG